MTEERSNRGVLLVLILAVAAGGAGCAHTHPYAKFDPITKGALVIADDIVVPDPLPVSKTKKQMVTWVSFPGTTLQITFDAPSPFPRLHCNKNKCESGPIDENAVDNPYGYHASVTGLASSNPASRAEQRPPGDPTVIIEY